MLDDQDIKAVGLGVALGIGGVALGWALGDLIWMFVIFPLIAGVRLAEKAGLIGGEHHDADAKNVEYRPE